MRLAANLQPLTMFRASFSSQPPPSLAAGRRAASEDSSRSESDEDVLSRDGSHLNLEAWASTTSLRRRLTLGLMAELVEPEHAPKPTARASAAAPAPRAVPAAPPGRLANKLVLVDACGVSADRRMRHITRHYRPDGHTSLASALFGLHNQSANIHTHLLGTVYVGSFVTHGWPAAAEAEAPFALALSLHACVGLLVGIFSVAYHAGEAAPKPTRYAARPRPT